MNRRNRVRFKTDLTVKVTCLNPPGTSTKGRLADLSAHGFSLILRRELAAGSAVQVEWDNADFVGELIYCQPYGDEFLAGVEVEDSVYDTARAALSSKNVM
jgi:c-di-GMP-binding flagellar brake protein YcgR